MEILASCRVRKPLDRGIRNWHFRISEEGKRIMWNSGCCQRSFFHAIDLASSIFTTVITSDLGPPSHQSKSKSRKTVWIIFASAAAFSRVPPKMIWNASDLESFHMTPGINWADLARPLRREILGGRGDQIVTFEHRRSKRNYRESPLNCSVAARQLFWGPFKFPQMRFHLNLWDNVLSLPFWKHFCTLWIYFVPMSIFDLEFDG